MILHQSSNTLTISQKLRQQRKQMRKKETALWVVDWGKRIWGKKKSIGSLDQSRIHGIKPPQITEMKGGCQGQLLSLKYGDTCRKGDRNMYWKCMEPCGTHTELYYLLIKTPDSAAFIALNVASNPFCPLTLFFLVSKWLLRAVNNHSSM